MTMKFATSAGALFLLLGTIAPAYAQHEEERKPQPEQQHQERPAEQPQRQEKPAAQPHPQPAKRPAPRPQQSYGGAYHGGVKPNGPTHGGVHHSGVPQNQTQVRAGFVQSRGTAWETEHRTWSQRGGYNGYRIPDARFRSYFGRDHFFRISSLPLVFVGGYPRFQYDGYWVTFIDPWPEAWSPTWYETDDCYVDYNGDGYYLYDRAHPGIAIAVTLSL